MMKPPFLQRIYLREDLALPDEFPTNQPFVRSLDISFTSGVTFLVGENGSGKSTLLEAIATICGLPAAGGGRNELAGMKAPHSQSELAPFLRGAFRQRPRDGYFFRAEFQAHFASLLEERKADPDFWSATRPADPFARFGGRSLHTRSHGEAFLEMFSAWLNPGIILMDEPEAALSPQRQLVLLSKMARLTRTSDVQFIVATHSPIILSFPGAILLSFDGGQIAATRLEDTSHFQVTKGILDSPQRYWKHLLSDDDDDAG
jgi:predicted ATPase